MIDALATRYHLLPSEVLVKADTLDVMVMDMSVSWHNYKIECEQAEANGKPKPAPKMSANKLQAMMAAVKGK
jgi:hypothetical protein